MAFMRTLRDMLSLLRGAWVFLLLVALAGCDSGEPGLDVGDEEEEVEDTTPPQVQIVTPEEGQVVSGEVNLSVLASDDFGVTRVELLVEGNVTGSAFEKPWGITWNTRGVNNGSRTITARAWDAAGNTADSDPVMVEVENLARVRFRNTARVPVELRSPFFRRILPGETLTYEDDGSSEVSYDARTDFAWGWIVTWDGELDLSSGRDREVRFDVPPTYSFFYLKNEGTSTFWSIEFTYGLAGTTHAQGPFGPGGPYPLGYHRVEGLGAIEGWALAEGTIRRWHPTVDFNFPNTVNQAITLTHP